MDLLRHMAEALAIMLPLGIFLFVLRIQWTALRRRNWRTGA